MSRIAKQVTSAAAGALVLALVGAGCGSSKRHVAVPARTLPPTTVAATTTTRAATTTTSTTRPPVTTPPTTAPQTTVPACPPNLAESISSTAGAGQMITVESSSYATTYATVTLWQRDGRCWSVAGGPWTGRIGANGFSDHHREGDNTTPTGIYGVGSTMYGNQPNPGVRYAYHDLVCGDWWDEDPASAEYNTFQPVGCTNGQPDKTFAGGSEKLWTETAAYPSFAVIDYNTGPIAPGAGSAIFFHADTGSPTAGCVSVPLSDLDFALRWLNPAEAPVFVMGPTSEITRL